MHSASFRLARQRLAPRAPRGSAVDVARSIGGLHAQVLSAADLSLWARVRGHRRGDLERALYDERTLVKTWLMRGTLHLVAADDLPLYVAALDPRGEYDGAWLRAFGFGSPAEVDRLVEAIGDALDGRALTRHELADAVGSERLRSGWGELLKPASRRGVLCFGPSDGRTTRFVRPDQWLAAWREVDPEEARAELVRRFLRAYAPATRDDLDRWIGASRRRRFAEAWDAVERVEVERGRFALAEDAAALARARRPRGVRLLGAFDPYVLAPFSDRPVAPERKAAVFRTAGWISQVVLVDGRVAGVWTHEQRAGRVRVEVDAWEPLDRAALEREASSLARYLGGELDLVRT